MCHFWDTTALSSTASVELHASKEREMKKNDEVSISYT